jgi:hypothetical protein
MRSCPVQARSRLRECGGGFAGTGGPAADQFSFCVALFEAVYGARPFPAVAGMELLFKLESCTIEFPDVPPRFGRVPRWLRARDTAPGSRAS